MLYLSPFRLLLVTICLVAAGCLGNPSGVVFNGNEGDTGTGHVEDATGAADSGEHRDVSAGPDTAGPDAAGADAAGSDAAGSDAAGADATGADATGADATGPDATEPDIAPCVAEPDDDLCEDAGTECGELTITDSCGEFRVVECGDCGELRCHEGMCCEPRQSCEADDPQCGLISDGCGGEFFCDQCSTQSGTYEVDELLRTYCDGKSLCSVIKNREARTYSCSTDGCDYEVGEFSTETECVACSDGCENDACTGGTGPIHCRANSACSEMLCTFGAQCVNNVCECCADATCGA